VKSKDARAFELFLHGKQSIEVAIELDMPADKVEELRVQYWRLSKLDDLEILYHETKYSLSLLLQLHDILKEKRITKDKDISELIDLANHGLPAIRNRFEEVLNQLAALENEKAALNTEIMGSKNSMYTNNETDYEITSTRQKTKSVRCYASKCKQRNELSQDKRIN
jgi:hypothetical protein